MQGFSHFRAMKSTKKHEKARMGKLGFDKREPFWGNFATCEFVISQPNQNGFFWTRQEEMAEGKGNDASEKSGSIPWCNGSARSRDVVFCLPCSCQVGGKVISCGTYNIWDSQEKCGEETHVHWEARTSSGTYSQEPTSEPVPKKQKKIQTDFLE